MENKKTKNILLAIMGLLILAHFVVTVLTIQTPIIMYVCTWTVHLFVVMYGFWLYKKPHGNMLKVAMLIFAAVNIVSDAIVIPINTDNINIYIVGLLTSGAVCYLAGRLDRIEQNKYLFPIITGIYFLRSILFVISGMPGGFLFACSLFGYPVMFLTLTIAYFVRYKEHKEAGISDK